jgi:multidrug transporter EmrE-like cation transporter
MSVMLLIFAVLFNAVAQVILKQAAIIPTYTSHKITLIAVGLFLGLLNTLCYLKSIEEIPLGAAYPLFSAASIVLIALISAMFLTEQWSLQKVAGLLIICAGIFIFARA